MSLADRDSEDGDTAGCRAGDFTAGSRAEGDSFARSSFEEGLIADSPTCFTATDRSSSLAGMSIDTATRPCPRLLAAGRAAADFGGFLTPAPPIGETSDFNNGDRLTLAELVRRSAGSGRAVNALLSKSAVSGLFGVHGRCTLTASGTPHATSSAGIRGSGDSGVDSDSMRWRSGDGFRRGD